MSRWPAPPGTLTPPPRARARLRSGVCPRGNFTRLHSALHCSSESRDTDTGRRHRPERTPEHTAASKRASERHGTQRREHRATDQKTNCCTRRPQLLTGSLVLGGAAPDIRACSCSPRLVRLRRMRPTATGTSTMADSSTTSSEHRTLHLHRRRHEPGRPGMERPGNDSSISSHHMRLQMEARARA